MELTQTERQNEKWTLKRKETLWDCWDSIKCNKIHIIVLSEEKEKEKNAPQINWRNSGWKCPYLGKERDIQIQKAHRVPNKMISKRHIPRHIKVKIVNLRIERES